MVLPDSNSLLISKSQLPISNAPHSIPLPNGERGRSLRLATEVRGFQISFILFAAGLEPKMVQGRQAFFNLQ
jgi:hypothetical protein